LAQSIGEAAHAKQGEMFTVVELNAADIPKILAADGGDWWRRDGAYWIGCLAEQGAGHRLAVVAADADGIIGYSYLNWHSQYPRFQARNIPEISDLRVAARHRRRGVATSIIAHFEEVARLAGRDAIGIGVGIYKDYGAAQRLYARLGFVPDGWGVTYDNADVRPGATVTVDDKLILWLVRDLKHASLPVTYPNGTRS
jgi:GNAT superfamily N-acetyltransferase